ncbi:MAG: hypothetical protein ABJH68_12980 [Ilumatobacter sp.]|uniref:hypothetical protein n=1 Tax=Ilumatobacter sp. TaxID=1967498 RepID=UPI0032985041
MSSASVERQQVLYLWMQGSALDSHVIGWAFHDGTAGAGPSIPAGDPPYPTGVASLLDGWMLLQSSPLTPLGVGQEHVNSYLEHEFVFERRVRLGT